MISKVISDRISESYTVIDHPSGLKMLLYPMEGYSSAYALFTTVYGSVDTTFKTDSDDDFIQIPDGIAHFLEHKMFDTKEGDVFDKFAEVGASANAYTSFDRTAYLFSCTENFKRCLEILLEFVQHPYFSPEKVEKEQGIIGQEIEMYNDDGDWRVFFNLLGALYKNHPVSIDIAGTVESIAKIDADMLYRCHKTFYNLRNMVLVVAGNFSVEDVIEVADKSLETAPELKITRKTPDEPQAVNKPRVEQSLEVALPLFQIGFKADSAGYPKNFFDVTYCDMLIEILIGEGSQLYKELYDTGLINQTFSAEGHLGASYVGIIFSGESRDPDAVYSKIKEAIAKLGSGGISDEDFELAKRILYGRSLSAFGNVRAIASNLLQAHISGIDVYTQMETISAAKKEDILPFISTHLNTERSAISIVWPIDGGDNN